MADEITTERLLLRGWKQSDFEAFAAFHASPSLTRYIGGPLTREQSWRRLASLAGHWVLLGFGYWALEERNSGDFVGSVGLWFSDGWPEMELGYWLVPEKHGFGYATEAGAAARDHAWDVVGAESLVSYINPKNDASKKVAGRLGAFFEGEIELLDLGKHSLYRHPRPGRSAADGGGTDHT